MITAQTNNLYHLVILAKSIPLIDKLRLGMYTNFIGNKPSGMVRNQRATIQVDLSQAEDQLYSHCTPTTRNEINRAQKEGFIIEQSTDLQYFVDYYNHFAKEKKLSPISINHLTRYKDHLCIYQSVWNGQTLSMHASLIDTDERIAMLLYSASVRLNPSVDRKMVSFANRFLHYKEFLIFKEQGIKTYDFSGICLDRTNPAEYGIAQFKQGFGGQIAYTTDYESFLLHLLLHFKQHQPVHIRINADDFGMSDNVNQAICKEMKAGHITHTSAMTNMPCFTQAIELAEQNNFTQQIGLHFCLTEGYALSNAIRLCPRFCQKEGQFIYRRNQALWLSKQERKAIAEEFSAQLNKLVLAGISPSHLDSHHHIHTEFFIFNTICPIAKKAGIRQVRISRNLQVDGLANKCYKWLFNLWIRLHGFTTTKYMTDIESLDYKYTNIEYECHPM